MVVKVPWKEPVLKNKAKVMPLVLFVLFCQQYCTKAIKSNFMNLHEALMHEQKVLGEIKCIICK